MTRASMLTLYEDNIDTVDPSTIRKMDKLVAEYPDTYRCISVDDQYHAKRYEVDSRYVRFGKPASEARREAGKRAASYLRRERTVNAVV